MGQYNANTDDVIQEVSIGDGIFSSPAYFNGNVYYHGQGDVLKAYSLTNGLLSPSPVAEGTTTYHGVATPSISSDGTANGIVWDVQYDATHAVLRAYDATTLTELYDTNQDAARDQMGVGVKFATPTIADGEVFVGRAVCCTFTACSRRLRPRPRRPESHGRRHQRFRDYAQLGQQCKQSVRFPD